MSEAKDFLKTKLLACVTEYCFEDSQSDPAFAKLVYTTIKDLFEVDTVVENTLRAALSPGLYSIPQPKRLPPSMEPIKEYAAPPSDTKKKSRHIPNAISAQIRNKINDMRDIVQEFRIERKDGRKGKRVDWAGAADAAYNRFNIRTQEGTKPGPRQFADAYNHLRHYDGVTE